MDENQKVEYQSVILGALLHDIGKFYLKAKKVPTGKHADISGNFIITKDKFAKKEAYDNSKFYSIFEALKKKKEIDISIVENAARYHSSPHTPRGANLLELIVNQADSYSTNERRIFEDRQGVGGSKFTPLTATFNKIFDKKEKSSSIFAYNATKLDSKHSFPIENKKKLEGGGADELVKQFHKELNSIKNTNEDLTFDHFYNTLLAILEKYLCFIPSDKSLDYPDVSLFDHLKSTSAISACLFHYHQQTGTLSNTTENQKNVTEKTGKKFLLVGGNISGIQKYLYQISSITGEGGVAKRLRARSFYISILVELIVIKILKELNLPLSCNLLCSGGKFIILAPNTETTKSRLAEGYKNISKWMIEEFSGELLLNLVWNVEICGNDFHMKSEKDIAPKEEYADSNFYSCMKSLEDKLREKKNRKFSEILISDNEWNDNEFVRNSRYGEYENPGKSVCKSCGKFPVMYPDPHEEIHEKTDEEKFCEKCAIDKVIGGRLADAKYIGIGIDTGDLMLGQEKIKKLINRKLFFFFNNYYFVEILKTYKFDKNYLCIEKIRDRVTEEETLQIGMVNRFVGNYVPVIEDVKKFETEVCQKICKLNLRNGDCDQYEYIKSKTKDRHLFTFECIAAKSSNYVDEKLLGNQNIGILKADVDNLGKIFSEGLKERLTISRYLTVSRMIDLFFSGWLYRILKEKPEFKNIYTVYSGGDDLVLVGPWEEVINFSKFLYDEFRRFTCNNDNITLSAGISVVKPKQSISMSVEQANLNLKESKKHKDKNSLTIWNTTIYWNSFENLKFFQGNLNKGYLLFPEILSRQFIHRLLKYQKMFLDANAPDNKKIDGLMFHSKMNYDVRRNIVERLGNEIENKFLIEIENNKELTVSDKELKKTIERLLQNKLITVNSKLYLNSKVYISLTKEGEKKKWFIKTIPNELLKLYKATISASGYDESWMENLKIPIFWTLYKTRNITKKEGVHNGGNKIS